jgi:hypothetical protein
MPKTAYVNYGSDYPKPQFVQGKWRIPYDIKTAVDKDDLIIYSAQEAISQTLFAHDIDAVVPVGNDADVLKAIKHGIRIQRAAEYPPASDYLDGIAKGDVDQIAAYKAACLAIKEKYPFPSV